MASLANPILEALPKVEQLSARVVRVLGLNPGNYTLQGTNTYLVGTGERRILIDTGEANKPDFLELLRETLFSLKARVHQILITHWHHDHTGGIEGVRGMFPDAIPQVWKFPHAGTGSKPPETATPYQYLQNGAKVETEGATLKVVATPGHTDDHMALVLEEENAVFTGDCILGQGSAVFEDLHSYMQSLSQLLSLRPAVLYPGHGPVITNSTEKIRQYIAHRTERERQVVTELEKHLEPVEAMELVKEIYKLLSCSCGEKALFLHSCKIRAGAGIASSPDHTHRAWDLKQSLWKGAEGNVLHHLSKLEKDSRVAKFVDSEGTRWSVINK